MESWRVALISVLITIAVFITIAFIIGVIQDSCETALNSSADVVFTATAEYYKKRINGEPFEMVKKVNQNHPLNGWFDQTL